MKISDVYSYDSSVGTSSVIPHPRIITNDLVGIEVELENVKDYRIDSRYWVSEEDGSLRNFGREFILRQPIGGKDLYTAISEASVFFDRIQPDLSWRCSTHMHLNVRSMEIKALRCLLLAFTVYERVLFKCSGKGRYRSNFCPAFGFAQNQMLLLSRVWNRSDEDFLQGAVHNWSKYTALNLRPIREKGSVELRISNPLITSSDLLRLCNRFLTLKKMSDEWTGTPQEFLSHLSQLDVHSVFTKQLTGDIEEPITQEDVDLGVILANDIIHLQSFQLPTDYANAQMYETILTVSKMRTLISLTREKVQAGQGASWETLLEGLLSYYDDSDSESWRYMPEHLITLAKESFHINYSYFVSAGVEREILREREEM